MKNRKRNRLKGYDYSRDNLYFITNCVKNNVCCLGRVISEGTSGTGRDLSVLNRDNNSIINPDNNPIINYENKSNIASKNNPSKKYVVELNQFGKIVADKINWLESQYKYVLIHNYVVMPNHFHLILEIDSQKVNKDEVKVKSVSSLIGALKSTSSHQIRQLGFEEFIWHRSFHDHIIKSNEAYKNISNYIDKNPQKWFEDKFFSESQNNSS